MKKNNSKDVKKHSRLSFVEREEIAISLGNNMKQSEIASLLVYRPIQTTKCRIYNFIFNSISAGNYVKNE